jgi:hypothetical protein
MVYIFFVKAGEETSEKGRTVALRACTSVDRHHLLQKSAPVYSLKMPD